MSQLHNIIKRAYKNGNTKPIDLLFVQVRVTDWKTIYGTNARIIFIWAEKYQILDRDRDENE